MRKLFKISFILQKGETALILTPAQFTKLNNALADAQTFTGTPYTKLLEEVKTINPKIK